jgi:NAD(P)H-hydrate repair Nnr-like enzyme with NAD(P)H-hydrate epimerase domain
MLQSARLGVAAVAIAALLVAGCGSKVIDDQKAEAAIKSDVEKNTSVKVASVDCPGDVEVKTGETFNCTVRAQDGRSATVTLKVLNENADVKVVNLKTNK